MGTPIDVPPTWLSSDRRLARYVARPVARFLAVEAAGGVLLLVATVVALVWANSPWSSSYESWWHTVAGLEVGSFEVREDLAHWVNDGLMALFFFVVGLEIKGDWSTASSAPSGTRRCPRSARSAAWSCPPCCSRS